MAKEFEIAKDPCCSNAASEAPFACNLEAFTAAERLRYQELRRMLSSAVIGKRELPDGLALQIATDRIALAHLAEWISFERKCCPFFDFGIEVARESGPVWLTLTGRRGVKDFLSQVFSG